MGKETREALREPPRGLTGPRRVHSALTDELRACMTRAGLTQADVARALGLSQKHLSRMLNGRAALSLDWAARIAWMCGRELVIMSVPAVGQGRLEPGTGVAERHPTSTGEDHGP